METTEIYTVSLKPYRHCWINAHNTIMNNIYNNIDINKVEKTHTKKQIM